MVASIKSLEAENAALREALYGKYGVEWGLAVVEKCLATSTKADHADAPFPLDHAQAKLWHRAQMEAYQHVLEMISIDPALAPEAVKYRVQLDGRDIGVYAGRAQHEALDNMAKDMGYSSYDEACKRHPIREGQVQLFPAEAVLATEAAAPFKGGTPWQEGEKVRFGRNNEREIEAFAGLFRYSGMGGGTYYGLTHKVSTDVVEAKNYAHREGVELLYWDSEKASNPDYERMLNTRETLRVMARFDNAASSSPDLNSAGSKSAEAEGQPFTVVGHNEYDRKIFIEHVVANDGLNAFAVAAARQPEAEFSVAIAGTLTEASNAITLPGEGLVPSGVVLTDPEVFGKVSAGTDPANEPG